MRPDPAATGARTAGPHSGRTVPAGSGRTGTARDRGFGTRSTTRPADPSLGSTLTEETALSDLGLVLRGDLDICRREQENPIGHALDRTPQAEREPGGEIHQAAGIALI